jgi:NAD(P)-dependent dehydrogenase (short-subunit alcohol dehydrogenase family)
MKLQDKHALVTGGAIRLGRAIALELARAGCHLAVHYGKSRKEALALKTEVLALGRQCRLYQADLSSASAVLALGRDVLRDFKNVPILVNSAAIFPRVSLEMAKAEDFDLPYKVNLRAPALLTQVIGVAQARRRIHSRIINIADVGAELAWPGYLPYSLSKAGLLQLTRASAAALAPYVLVNAVSPGPMLMPAKATAIQKRSSVKRSLLKKLGGPEEIARAVRFVAESDFMTGSNLVVDGGRKLAS